MRLAPRILALIACSLLLAFPARAQSIYRCGDAYSTTPCAGARVIGPAELPSNEAVVELQRREWAERRKAVDRRLAARAREDEKFYRRRAQAARGGEALVRAERERDNIPYRAARWTRSGWEPMTDQEYARIRRAHASRPVVNLDPSRRRPLNCVRTGANTALCH